jgi:putative membrane-bound dehydrogenase-like protein
MKISIPSVPTYFILLNLLLAMSLLPSCNNSKQGTAPGESDSLTEVQRHLPENALKGLTVSEGLELHTFATEPMLQNPTNIDVDDRGRVWVTEAYNYRPGINGNPTSALGDRIMILEDNNGDGKADTAKVFYQGPELNAPLGICVLGNRVIVSQSPYVWVFYDDNGDDKADRKEIMFSGISGDQHDHGVHAFTFAADGKLYFNMGNEGQTLKDKNGKDILDKDGDVIGPKKYKQGMAFRCNLDGSQVECLANNFRNPYEVAVDSYGTLWQSDNDDDGNKGTRINYVMQYGNYGYKDEITGEGWQANRTNEEDSTPQKHWHLNDPGAMPNLLQTGAGSPTGILVYEGSLLPASFHNQMIHCDAGPNVVRAYPVAKNGAGYTAKTIDMVKGQDDQWFRPSDVCVAPDGSLIIADWYDPGVGGHQAGDQTRGRIYRLAPPNSKYSISSQDYSSPAGAVVALQNPNLSVRYKAFIALQQMGLKAVAELEKLWNSPTEPRMRARAFWALVKMPTANVAQYLAQAIHSDNSDLRIVGVRAASQFGEPVVEVVKALVNDKDPQVRRECALALHHCSKPEAAALWATLAMQHDGKDRWYLEALGLGADGQWDKFFAAYLSMVKDPLQTAASRDMVWRARSAVAVPLLASLASDATSPLQNRLRYFRAFDFNEGAAKSALLLKMIEKNSNNDNALNKLVLHALDIKSVVQSPQAQKALAEVLNAVNGTDEYIQLVGRFEVKSQNENLLQLAISQPNKSVGKNAAGLLLRLGGSKLIWKVMDGKDTAQQYHLIAALASVGNKESIDILQTIIFSDKYAMPTRVLSAKKIGNSQSGEQRVLQILKLKKVPAVLIPDVVAGVSNSWMESVRSEAASYLPKKSGSADNNKAPSMSELAALKGNAVEGERVFSNSCNLCHQVNDLGYDFGPKLTEIGSKLPKEGLLASIVNPSAGIGFGYEGWELKMKDGSTYSGIFASKTETDIDIKFPGGARKQLKTSDVKSMTAMKQSMMPEGLYQNMSSQDMANLLEYLSGLKKK